jgi:hypothetical protein
MNPDRRPSFPFALLFFWLRRILFVWFLIASLIFLIQILHCGVYQDNERVRAVLSFVEHMPSIVKNSLGGDILQMDNVAGFIAVAYIHPLVLTLYMIFAVSVPSGLLAGHVQSGDMELILSRSITKTQVYICAVILTLAGMFTMIALMFLGTVVGTSLFDFGQDIPLYPFFRASVNGAFLAASAASVSLLCAASFRTRGRAVGTAIAFLVANYLINIFSEWLSFFNSLRPFTLFYYINVHKVLNETAWPVRDMSVLAAVTIIATLAGAIVWQRRDLPL